MFQEYLTVIKTTPINISVICNSIINQGIPQKTGLNKDTIQGL